jgi:hypothetical protein
MQRKNGIWYYNITKFITENDYYYSGRIQGRNTKKMENLMVYAKCIIKMVIYPLKDIIQIQMDLKKNIMKMNFKAKRHYNNKW